MTVAVRPPELIKQLDGSADAGANCGMAAAAMAVNFATQGARKPTPTMMRKRAGAPSGPGRATNTANQERAVESFDGKGEHSGNSDSTGGREPLKYHRKLGQPWKVLQDALDTGTKVVNVQIDYDVVNSKWPSKSGDKNYTGDHSITLFGRRQTKTGMWELRSYDPLYDGRKAGVPKGPQWLPEWVIKMAAEKFAEDKDVFVGGVIPMSPKVQPEPPVITPPPVTPPVDPPVIPSVDPGVPSLEDRFREALEAARALIDEALDPVETAVNQIVVLGASGADTEPPVVPKPE
jgi:hypothetical protein